MNDIGKLHHRGSSRASFAETLRRVLGMTRRAEESSAVCAELRDELRALSPQSQARLSLLLNLGREADGSTQRTSGALARPSAASAIAAPLDVFALCDTATLSRRYLERGLAAACAGQLSLDTELGDGPSPDQRLSVSERAWTRFGRELASSEPGEWTWFACYRGRPRTLDKLYVRHGNSAWWSFAASIDRPLRGQIDADRRRAMNGGGQHSQGSSLETLLAQEGTPSRRALHRALTSVHARLGKVRTTGAAHVATR